MLFRSKSVDVNSAANCIRWYGEAVDKVYDEIAPTADTALALITRQPVGVVGVIVPWNYPMIMASWKLGPALAAGNTSVLKPASFTSITALMLGEVFQEVDLPPGVANIVAGPGGTAGEVLASSNLVDKTAFTGSTEVGRRIMQLASGTVKPVTLELGGKSANIVLDDDAFAKGVARGVSTMMTNSGQSCNAPTRMLVPAARMDEAIVVAREAASQITVGDPNGNSMLGPVVNKTQFDKIQKLIQAGIDEGATLVSGGVGRPDGIDKGYFVKPTVFANVTPAMTIAREEIFGPVLAIMGYEAKVTEREQSGRTVHRVRLGPFEEKGEADLTKEKLMAAGFEAALVRAPK